MPRHLRGLAALGAAAIVAGSVMAATSASASTVSTNTAGSVGALAANVVGRTTQILHSCALPRAHHAGCLAQLKAKELLLADGTTRPAAGTSTTSGYVPSDLQSAYNLTTASANNGGGQTVAIVDAYDDPTAESDLGTYRSAYGLSSCTTANGCFRKLNQNGAASPLPSVDTGWAQEISLDLDMVSAICPNCHILLIEANSATTTDLAAAVNKAAALGANAISNSYGGNEASSETSLNSAFNHPGVAITASAGDSGYGVEFPAAVPTVTAVGGTSLTRTSGGRGWSEKVWGTSSGGGLLGLLGASEGTGSGCSRYETKPTWQHDAGCAKRTVADVSAVADPNTGVAVYDSTADSSGNKGWLQFGGTSVSSPLIAAVYALAGNAATIQSGTGTNYVGAWYAYAHTSALYDVTSGANGSCNGLLGGNTSKQYLCTGEPGYDGPTGLGTPNGTGAF